MEKYEKKVYDKKSRPSGVEESNKLYFVSQGRPVGKLSPAVRYKRIVLQVSWAVLGASWGCLGRSWERLGGILGDLGSLLGSSWAVSGGHGSPKGFKLNEVGRAPCKNCSGATHATVSQLFQSAQKKE